jgi:hypothetical protein
MKSALLPGIIIGVLSGAWLFAMHAFGYDMQSDTASPFEYASVLIPLIGLYFGVKNYRDKEKGGQLSFLSALIECFKILLVGGIIAVFVAILYINYISTNAGGNIRDFSGRMFGALLVGLLFSLGVSLLLMTKTTKID